ncbi:phosphoribosylanthranilate isomerase [Anaerovorax odorimutans]|uniref:N-(5'-phosphoribosyl)anthranilate isomerase n=1 Tax=Anaerovorax odorimutans TaxID=109327 RepID=A0ABT1RNL2_9FIRM|nr:phosphoribosylanthranilate isomerase [Anaerovorax odorimutans]MCQ4636793.1 phosphoribosylanthranilate isomerase [Anaerovorax odorimutans]
MTKIKICGLTRQQDIDFVNEAGPDYAGFVFAESRRQVDADQASVLRKRLAGGIQAVGVFVNAPGEQILDICQRGIIDWVQLHGNEDHAYITELRRNTDKPLIKAVSMSRPFDPGELKMLDVDYFLFDQGGGGSGRTFDWSRIPQLGKPFFLAGGLGPDNLTQAVRRVRPFAVDLSSGVETDGVKDREKILEAVRSVRNE